MKNYRNLTAAASISLVFLILYNISSFAFSCKEIRSDVIRLHVIANSDSDEDQALKLQVRDALLAKGENIFDGTVTPENAKEKITPEIENLEDIAEQVIKENGYHYQVKTELITEYFDTRTYDDTVTLPAGKYLALKVTIGEGKGKNWWCVMFPSLCLPAAGGTDTAAAEAVFSENEAKIVTHSNEYEVRFKLIEYIEKFREHVDNKKAKGLYEYK